MEGLVALYAEDAKLTPPNGTEVAGRNAIRAFQTEVYARGVPCPTPARRIIGVSEIAVKIKVLMPDGSVRSTSNFFYLDSEGLIQTLNVYARGG